MVRGTGTWSFLVIYRCISLFLFWSPQSHSPLWLSSTANERANAPNRATRDFSLLSLPSAVLYYYECDITPSSQDPFVLMSPPPTSTTYLCLCISSLLANVLLNITTHYTPSPSTYLSLHLSFHLHLPLTLFLL